MTKKEIAEIIDQIKREIARFQEIADELQFSEKDKQKQIDLYLDTMNKLKEQLKKATD